MTFSPEDVQKEIYLIRHAQTEYNARGMVQGSGIDADLNEEGRRQAQAFFNQYGNVPFDKIYISALKRTYQTVEPFIKQKGIPYEAHTGLNEISWGKVEGNTADANNAEQHRHYTETLARWGAGELDVAIGSGESPNEVACRQAPVLKHIMAAEEEKIIMICMHGRAMRILLCGLLQVPLQRMDIFEHQNTGLYHLYYLKDKSWHISLMNDTIHLES